MDWNDEGIVLAARSHGETGLVVSLLTRDGTRELATWSGLPIDPARVILDGPCPQESRVGGFKVEMNGTIGYTAIDGVVRNGVPPSSIADPTFEDADCRLLRRRRPERTRGIVRRPAAIRVESDARGAPA